MQGPAGACLREPIDFLDNLDGPNPLMMGKQKYCFLQHFYNTSGAPRTMSASGARSTATRPRWATPFRRRPTW